MMLSDIVITLIVAMLCVAAVIIQHKFPQKELPSEQDTEQDTEQITSQEDYPQKPVCIRSQEMLANVEKAFTGKDH